METINSFFVEYLLILHAYSVGRHIGFTNLLYVTGLFSFKSMISFIARPFLKKNGHEYLKCVLDQYEIMNTLLLYMLDELCAYQLQYPAGIHQLMICYKY